MSKTIFILAFAFLFCQNAFSQSSNDSIARFQIDSLEQELMILEKNLNYHSGQIRTLNKNNIDLQDSLEELKNQISELEFQIDGFSDSLNTSIRSVIDMHHADIHVLRIQFQKEKKGIIGFLLGIFLLMTGIFIFFYYKDYKLEKFVEKETMRTKVETENQIRWLNSKWKKR